MDKLMYWHSKWSGLWALLWSDEFFLYTEKPGKHGMRDFHRRSAGRCAPDDYLDYIAGQFASDEEAQATADAAKRLLRG